MAALAPLTHHEIIAIIAPFAQAGLQVDLGASDRPARQLVFRPREPTSPQGLAPCLPPVREQLRLDCSDPGRFVLHRCLIMSDGCTATLEGEAQDAAWLMSRFAAVPAARQLPTVAGVTLALHHRLLRASRDESAPALLLKEARVMLPGLVLQIRVSGVSGYAAEIALERAGHAVGQLPADLLEVLGRAWSRLTPDARGWNGSVQLRGADERRGADAEARLAQAVKHLLHTLAEPPQRFHERHRAARWGIAARSTWPIALAVLVLAFGSWLHSHGEAANSALAMLANLAPPLLLVAFFTRREMPHIGLPRVPRQPRADAWRTQP